MQGTVPVAKLMKQLAEVKNRHLWMIKSLTRAVNQVGDAISLDGLKNERETLRRELSEVEQKLSVSTSYGDAFEMVLQKKKLIESTLIEPLRANHDYDKYSIAITSVVESMNVLAALIEADAKSHDIEMLRQKKVALEERIERINEKLRKIRERRKA